MIANGRPTSRSRQRNRTRTHEPHRVLRSRRASLAVRIAIVVGIVFVVAALVLPLINNGTRLG